MACVNACSHKKYCFMLRPYYTRGHVMCFNNGIAITWCIKCGCKTKNEASCCYAFNEVMANDDDERQLEVDK